MNKSGFNSILADEKCVQLGTDSVWQWKSGMAEATEPKPHCTNNVVDMSVLRLIRVRKKRQTAFRQSVYVYSSGKLAPAHNYSLAIVMQRRHQQFMMD